MRWLYTAIIVVFVVAILIFAVQNMDAVTVNFLGFSIGAPMALLAIAFYVFGMVTGSSLFGLLRSSYRKARQH